MAPEKADRFSSVKLLVEVAAVVIAGIALVYSQKANNTSEKALYVAELAPFKPTVVANDPLWKIEGVRIGTEQRLSLILITTITFSNQGAQPGCIADLAAVLRVPVTADTKRFGAYQFLNTEKLFEIIRKARPIYEAYEASFAPIVILGKQQVSKTILFRRPDFDRSDLKEGTYTLGVVGNECSTPDQWTQFVNSTYVADKNQVANLIRGKATIFESEERIRAIRTLKTR